MKAILTFFFVLSIGVGSRAQDSKVETIEKGIAVAVTTKEVTDKKTTEVARLYRRANSRVKKALSFTTKRNGIKMA